MLDTRRMPLQPREVSQHIAVGKREMVSPGNTDDLDTVLEQCVVEVVSGGCVYEIVSIGDRDRSGLGSGSGSGSGGGAGHPDPAIVSLAQMKASGFPVCFHNFCLKGEIRCASGRVLPLLLFSWYLEKWAGK